MTVVTLTATSLHATAGPPSLTQPVTAPTSLLEYEPPPLPPADAFRVAAASALAAVPLTYDTARRVWRLLADYSYAYDGVTLTAKAGYAYDLASVPRPLWWLIAPNELSLVAPLFHDLLYDFRGVLPASNSRCVARNVLHSAVDCFICPNCVMRRAVPHAVPDHS